MRPVLSTSVTTARLAEVSAEAERSGEVKRLVEAHKEAAEADARHVAELAADAQRDIDKVAASPK